MNTISFEEQWQQVIKSLYQKQSASWKFQATAKQSIDADSKKQMAAILQQALHTAHERQTALHVLYTIPFRDIFGKLLFPTLIWLVSQERKYSADILKIILLLDREWMEEQIPHEIEKIISTSATYDVYEAFAWVLFYLHSSYLHKFLQGALEKSDIAMYESIKWYKINTQTSRDDFLTNLELGVRSNTNDIFILKLIYFLDDTIKMAIFPTLVWLLSWKHEENYLIHDVIISMKQEWVQEQLPIQMNRVLLRQADEGTYKNFSELLRITHSPYLEQLINLIKSEN